MKSYLKSVVEKFPYSVGRYLANVPFRYRLGYQYSFFTELLDSGAIGEDYIVQRFSKIFSYAKKNFTFYNSLYKEAGVYGLEIKSLSDIEKVPVINKEMIRPFLSDFKGALKSNTGGTSGTPFAFYLDKHAFAREWAHMHKVWALKDYNFRDIKLTFRGRNLGDRRIVYNPVHNEFVVNTYKPLENYLLELITLIDRHSIKYLHGYPSTIYTFLKELEAIASSDQKGVFKRNVKCCLLGSEFPVPYMANYISKDWGLEYISWYGHSEMCILAYDQYSTNEYTPFHSYGYVEVDSERLIGTSYHNFDMPLIRYDTSDLVTAKKNDVGLVQSFSIKEGRSGDFVIDKNGKSLSLTSLIFGRHHEIFAYADCIQVKQEKEGEVILMITTSKNLDEEQALSMFDLSNVEIDFTLSIIPAPILTTTGKMPLKV
jgi:phenylacetate-CoA ligase